MGPKKKLSKSDLKPTVKIKAVFEPEEKTPRRKRKEPVVEDGPAEKISLFDEIPPIPEIPAKEKVSDHFPDKEKPLPVEESIVIVPTAISVVESAPDDKSKINDHGQERNKEPKPDEKILITARVLPEKPEIEPSDANDDDAKHRNKISDHFVEREKKGKGEEEILIITPHPLPEKSDAELEEDIDEVDGKKRNKVSDHFAEKDKKPKSEEEKIVIVPYDMDKDIPEVEVEVKKKKKISRENLKSAVDVKIDIPTPDATVKRKKKKEPIVDEEIKNPLFAAMPKEEKKVEEIPPPVEDEEEEEEEEEEVKVVEQPKKKLSKSDLKPTVKIKAVFEPEEKTPRRKRKEPTIEEDLAEKTSLFEGIPEIPVEKPDTSQSKVKDHFPEKDKATPVEEIVVITPTIISEVESSPDEKSKVSDHFLEKEKKPKEEEKIVIIPKVLPGKPDAEQEAVEDEDAKKKK